MAKAPRKAPYTEITHELLEALARTPLPGRHFRIMMALLRLLDGWHITANRIGADQLSRRTGVDVSDVRRCLKDLTAWEVIRRSGGDRGRGRAAVIEIIRDFDSWKVTATSESQRRADGRDKTGRVPPVMEGQKGGEGTLFSENGVTEENGVTTARKRGDKGVENRGETPPTKESKESKDSGGPTSSDPPSSPQDVRRLVNFVAGLEGEADEKLAWVMSGEGLKILGEVEASMPDDATRRQRSGKLQSLTIRYYNQYLKGDRPFRGAAAVAAHKAERAAQASRSPSEPVVAANDPTAYETSTVIQGMFDD